MTGAPLAEKEDAVPHVEGLVDVRDILQRQSGEADDAQVQPVRVDAEILRSAVFAGGAAELAGVEFLVPAAEIIAAQDFVEGVFLRVGEGVPAPLGLGSERNAQAVVLREGLQAGYVGRIGEFSVAHRKGSQRIHGVQVGVVPGDQGFAVDALGAGCQCQRCKKQKFSGHKHVCGFVSV